MNKLLSTAVMLLAFSYSSCGSDRTHDTIQKEDSLSTKNTKPVVNKIEGENMDKPLNKSNEEWKKELTPEQYHVLREKGTEKAFKGKFDEFFEPGTYYCAACGNPLFESEAKYNSGCGWPAFTQAIADNKVKLERDKSFGMIRTEVLCARCNSHLGHVFDDGPAPLGTRYCINSVSLEFKQKDNK